MEESLQNHVIQVAEKAVERFEKEKEIARHVKLELDKVFHRTWHCIVGRKFYGAVSPINNHLFYFKINEFTFLIFKTQWTEFQSKRNTKSPFLQELRQSTQ